MQASSSRSGKLRKSSGNRTVGIHHSGLIRVHRRVSCPRSARFLQSVAGQNVRFDALRSKAVWNIGTGKWRNHRLKKQRNPQKTHKIQHKLLLPCLRLDQWYKGTLLFDRSGSQRRWIRRLTLPRPVHLNVEPVAVRPAATS